MVKELRLKPKRFWHTASLKFNCEELFFLYSHMFKLCDDLQVRPCSFGARLFCTSQDQTTVYFHLRQYFFQLDFNALIAHYKYTGKGLLTVTLEVHLQWLWYYLLSFHKVRYVPNSKLGVFSFQGCPFRRTRSYSYFFSLLWQSG
jgi:hypothetical protein